MNSVPVRRRPRALGWLILGTALFLGEAQFVASLCAAPATEETQAGLRRNWLPALFAPAQRDERQVALARLETAGLSLEGDSFLESIRTGHRPLINLFRQAGIDVNVVGREGRTPLLTAALQRDWPLFDELLSAGADANRADAAGLTPLMAAAAADEAKELGKLLERNANLEAADRHGHRAIHYAVASGSKAAVQLLLQRHASVEGPCCDGQRDLCEHAFAGENWEIISGVLAEQKTPLEWRTSSRNLVQTALQSRDREHLRLLLSKHGKPPTPEGRAQPLLAYAVLEDKLDDFKLLLEAGADPNTPLESPTEKVFSDAVRASYTRHYLEEERGMTTLMLASGMSKIDFVKALLEKGAKRGVGTAKYGMVALSFAAVNENPEIMQLLINGCPKPEELRIEISLAQQSARVIRYGVEMLRTEVSTGRPGFRTATGRFVVTDKHQDHKSTIYKGASMPYFMRLNCRDFGMHEGVVPGYPASHGCIRLPAEVARKLFKEIPVGTLVTIE